MNLGKGSREKTIYSHPMKDPGLRQKQNQNDGTEAADRANCDPGLEPG